MKKKTILGTLSVAFLATVTLASCGPTTKTYHVKFTNGNEVVNEKDYKENEVIVAPEDPAPYEKDHKTYTFDAWYDGEDKFEPGVTKATKNVEYIAKFNGVDIKYTVTFMNEGEEFAKITDAKYGDSIEPPQNDPTKDSDKKYDYEFDDWYYQDTEIPLEDGDTVEGNTVLEARYTPVAHEYDVKFTKGAETTTKQFSIDNLSVTAPTFTPTAHYTGIWSADGEHVGEKTAGSGATITFTEEDLGNWEFKYVESATPYLITFEKGGQTVDTITKKITDSTLEFAAPTFTPTEHYDGEWYCEDLGEGGTSLASGATCTALTAQNLDNYTFVYQEEPHEYTVTFKKNGQSDIVKKITVLDGADTAPTFTAADYRTGKWVSSDPAKELDSGESFDFTGNDLHDWTFNYNEVDTDYTITFKKNGEQDVKVTVNLSNLTFTAPTFTPTEHYDGAWVCAPWTTEGTSLSLGSGASHLLSVQSGELGDHTFVYGEEAIEYDVKFVEPDGSTVVDTQQISAESLVIEETPGHEPTDHYDGVWKEADTGIEADPGDSLEFTEEQLGEHTLTWTKTSTPHVYTITFVYEDGETESVEREATIESPQITAPATEATQAGFTYKWVCDDFTMDSEGTKTFTTDDLGDYTLVETPIGNKYTVTLDANGGTLTGDATMEVTFGEDYEITTTAAPNESFEDYSFLGWYDENDNKYETTGTWLTASNVTLYAKWGFDFEGDSVPSCITSTSSGIDSITLSTDKVLEGNKSLKISVNETKTDYFVDIAENYLKDMLDQTNATAIQFDAISTLYSGNFRCRYDVDKTDGSHAYGNWCYELNGGYCGIYDTRWKTFTFQEHFFKYGMQHFLIGNFGEQSGDPGKYNPADIYIDNIRPVVDANVDYSFENGVISQSGSNYSAKSGGHSQNASGTNPYPTDYAASRELIRLQPEGEALSSPLVYCQEEGLATDGHTSISFGKQQGSIPIYLGGYSKGSISGVSEFSYLTFDLLSTTAYNGNSIYTGRWGENPEGITPSVVHEANKWYQIKIKNVWKSKDETNYSITDDGRFLYFVGSLEATLYIDNIQFHN